MGIFDKILGRKPENLQTASVPVSKSEKPAPQRKTEAVKETKTCELCGKETTDYASVYAGQNELALACRECRMKVFADREHARKMGLKPASVKVKKIRMEVPEILLREESTEETLPLIFEETAAPREVIVEDTVEPIKTETATTPEFVVKMGEVMVEIPEATEVAIKEPAIEVAEQIAECAVKNWITFSKSKRTYPCMVCHGEFDLLFDADRLCPECKKRQMEKAGHTINGNITTDKRFGMFGLHGVENVRSELYVALENAVNYSDSPVFSNFREKPRHTKFCFFESQHDGRVKEILRNYYCVDFGVERLPGIANCSYFCEYGKATLPTRVGGVGVEYFSRLCDKERLPCVEIAIGRDYIFSWFYTHFEKSYAGGYKEDLRIVVDSVWEANMMRLMGHYGIAFEYQKEGGITFKDGPWYMPDFYLPDMDAYLEVKGLWDKRSLRHLSDMRKERPDVTLYLADSDVYRYLTKKYASMIPEWESHALPPKSNEKVAVVGMSFVADSKTLQDVCVGGGVALVREPENTYDSSAVLVTTEDGRPIGHLAIAWATIYSPKIAAGFIFDAEVVEIENKVIHVRIKCVDDTNVHYPWEGSGIRD